MNDTRKTKAQLVAELEALRRRVAELECHGETDAADKDDPFSAGHGHYRELLELSPIPHLVFDLRTQRILFANQAAIELYGYTSDELRSMTLDNLRVPQDGPSTESPVLDHDTSGQVQGQTVHHCRKDGTLFRVTLISHSLHQDNRTTGIVAVFDTTRLKGTDEAIGRYRELWNVIATLASRFVTFRFDDLDDIVNDALRKLGQQADVDRCYVFVLSDDGATMTNTHEWCADGIVPQIDDLQQLSTADFAWALDRMRDFDVLYLPRTADVPESAETERRVFAEGGIQSLLCVPMLRKDRLIGFVGFDSVRSESTWRSEDIALLRIVGEIFANALDRQNAEAALRDRETRLRILTEKTPAILWSVDTDLRFISSTGAALRELGLHPGQVVGQSLYEFFDSQDPEFPPIAAHRRALEGEHVSYEFRWKELVFQTHVEPLYGSDGDINGCIGVALDITQRTIAEEKQRESEEKWRSIAENSADNVMIVDPDGRILFINRTVPGLEPKDVIGRRTTDFLDDDDARLTRACYQRVLRTGRPDYYECNYTDSSGQTLRFECRVGPIRHGEDIIAMTVSASDVTERMRSLQLTELQQTVLERIAVGAPLIDTLDTLCLRVQDLISGANCAVMLLDHDTGCLNVESAPGMVPELVASLNGQHPSMESGSCGVSVHTGTTVIAADTAIDPRWRSFRALAIRFSIRSCWSIPIRTDEDTIVGTFSISQSRPSTPSPFQQRIMDAARHLAGIAVQRKRNEETIRDSEERFRQLAENIDEVFWLYDREDSRFLYVSPSYEHVWAQSRERLYSDEHACFERVHPDDRDDVISRIQNRVENSDFEIEYRLLLPDGQVRWVRDRAFVIPDDSGHVRRIAGIAEDITARKQSEIAVRDSEERFRQLAENITEVFWLTDWIANKVLYVSPAYERVWGQSCQSLYDDPASWVNSVHPDDRARVYIAFANDAEDGRYDIEYRLLLPDGTLRWIHDRAFPICDSDGRVYRVAGLSADITPRVTAEYALRESERRVRQMAEHMEQVFWLFDCSELRFLYVSPSFETVWDMPCQSLMEDQRSWLDRVHPDDLERVSKVIRTEVSTGHYDLEYRLLMPNGTVRWIRDRAFPIQNARGEVYRIAGTAEDITYKKETEATLLRAKRLESAGQVAGQIAHDFNNLLGPIMAYPELIRTKIPVESSVSRMLDDLEDAATQMAEINQQLLTLSRRGHYNLEPVNINELVDRVLRTADLPETIAIQRAYETDLLPARGGRSQLARVVANLIKNAAEAMDGHGALTVRTQSVYLDQSLGRYETVKRGEYVLLEMIDTGPGIEPNMIDRIFDPFFTTKSADKRRGSGLGLAVVHSVVEDHDGYLDLESAPNQGTTFRIYLPIDRSVDEISEGDSRAIPSGHGERVLVIDDDGMQRRLSQTALEQIGYVVDTLSRGEDAIAAVTENSYAVVVIDMVMEGIDGAETLKRIREICPDQPAVILSGYATGTRVKDALQLGRCRFLSKPVRIVDLAEVISSMITGSVTDSTAISETLSADL